MRLTTRKEIQETKLDDGSSQGEGKEALLAAEVLRKVEGVERRYQEELNKGFAALSEGEFKGLRRQLPVTRQKVEWEKVGGYRVSLFCPFSFSLSPSLFWVVARGWSF